MAETPSWLSQYPEVKDDSWLDQYKEVKEKPFLDISETASALGRAATSLPTTTMASLSQAWEGLDNPWKRSEGYLARRQEMQALQDELAKEEEEAAASGDISTVSSTIREATPSLGFSGATLIPSMGAAAGTLALSKSPMAARGAAAATSALMAYRMAGAQFLDDAKDRIDSFFAENLNREPTEQEKEEAYQELLPLARKFGAAEAGPEALGNLALGGAGKYIRRALGGKNGVMELASNALGKVTGTKAALAGAGALTSQIGTEAVTGVEQQRIQKQFEEGVMRGESPESVPLEERTLDDYIKSFKEVAPATIAMTGMMGAAGLGPTAIARGIKALRSTPPERQTQIQKDLQSEAGAIPKDTVPDQTNEEKLAAMEAGGTTVVDPDGKTAVIPLQQPELPSMPSPDEVAVQLNTDAAKSLEAAGSSESAKAQVGFDATLKEILPKTSQPTVQLEQAAEEVAPEVTPSPTMEQAAVIPTVEEPTLTPEPELYAPAQVPSEESVYEEPQDRVEGREAEEASLGDSLLRSKEGEVKEEVAPSRKTQVINSVFAAIQSHLAGGGEFQIPGNPPLRITPKNANQFSVSKDGDLVFSRGKKGGVIPVTDVAAIGSQVGAPFDVLSLFEETPVEQPTISDALVIAESDNGESFDRLSALIGDRQKAADEIETLTGKDVFSAWPIVVDAVADSVSVSNGQFVDTEAKAEKLRSLYREAQAMPASIERANAIEQITLASNINKSNRDSIKRKKITPPEAPQPSLNLPALIAVRDNNATPEQVQSLVDQGLVEQVDGQNIITEAGVAAMPEDQRPKLTPAERAAEVERMGVPVERDATKPEQQNFYEWMNDSRRQVAIRQTPPEVAQPTPSKEVSIITPTIDGPQKVKGKTYLIPNYRGPKLVVRKTKKGGRTIYWAYLENGGMLLDNRYGGQETETESINELLKSAIKRINAWGARTKKTAWEMAHASEIALALNEKKNVLASTVDTYGITLPKGYVKQGELYVFQPTAAEKQISGGVMMSPLVKGMLETFAQASAAWSKAKSAIREQLSGTKEAVYLALAEDDFTMSQNGNVVEISLPKGGSDAFSLSGLGTTLDKYFRFGDAKGIAKVTKKAGEPFKITFGNEKDASDFMQYDGRTPSELNEDFKRIYQQLSESKPQAAEKPTPDSVAVEPGATRGAQTEPVEGSISTVPEFSTKTEISSRENLGPEVAAAEKKQAAADEAAKKRQKKQDESTKNSLNSILDPQKKNAVTGTVTKADVETAREALTNSGEIPNAYLTNVYESVEAFLADKANARLFPSAYARLQTEKNIEGLYENGQTLIFAKQIQVSNLDRNLAKMLGITPEQAAARRVIAHENGHKAISLFTMAEKRELRGYLMRAYSDEQIAKLVETYDEYADWRTNLESRFEALEELLMRDFEKMDKIPTGGVWDDIVQFLKRVWRRLTGQKGEPTLKNLKDVARLMRNAMKRPAVPLGSFTLKDGGKVKLSVRAYHGTPHKVDKFSLSKIGTGEGAQVYGWGLYFAQNKEVADAYRSTLTQRDAVRAASQIAQSALSVMAGRSQDEAAQLAQQNLQALQRKYDDFRTGRAGYTVSNEAEYLKELQADVKFAEEVWNLIRTPRSRWDESIMPKAAEGNLYTVELLPDEGDFLDWDKPLSEQSEKVKNILSPIVEELIQRQIKKLEDTPSIAALYLSKKKLRSYAEEFLAPNLASGMGLYDLVRGLEGNKRGGITPDDMSRIASEYLASIGIPGIRYFDADSRGKKEGTRNYVIFDENLVKILEENGQSFNPPQESVKFSRPQFASDTDAATSAGNEAARSTIYSERDMDVREAIRRAYEAMPKDTSVAVPIGELFAKTEELLPDVTQDEFSNVLQDLFEDNGAVLQEGEVVEPLTEQDRRYLALAEDEDANQEELQRMVDEVAKEVGATNRLQHWTNSDTFTRFDPIKIGTGQRFIGTQVNGFWFNDANGTRSPFGSRKIEAFLILKNPKIFESAEAYDAASQGFNSSDEFTSNLVGQGYDGVIIKPAEEWMGSQEWDFTNYVAFNPSQIKSADSVTRDDQGRIIPLSRRFDTGADIRGQINVTTPEGRRAGFVVVMPRAAKASKIPIDEIKEASKPFKEDLIEASKGREEKAAFKGNVMRGNVVPDHNVNATELYKKAANDLLDSLLKNHDILDVAESVQDPDLQAELGMQIGGVVQPEDILNVRQYLGALLQRRLTVAISSEKNPKRLRQLEMARRSINAYSDGASGGGTALNNAKQVQNDPELKGDFFFSQATREKAQKAKDKLDAITGGTEKITDIITGAEQKAAEETTQAEVEAQESAVEDDEYAKLVSEGEEGLEGRRKTVWERAKMILRRLAMYARADKLDIKEGSKASLSAEQRKELDELNAILRMPKAERDKAREKDLAEFDALMTEFLGLESEAKTPEQKKTRKKREKMVNTAKKRAEAGKSLETPQEGEVESSEEQVSKAERTAQAILKDLSERYSDPLIIKEKKPNVDAMRELYKERVKQGVGPNQMTEKSFVNKAVELGADEKTAGILWKAAELEIDAREAMRQDKILQRKAAVGARADAQAHRIIFAKERLKRQSGFAKIDTNPNKDTIIQAFRDQVKNPVSLEDFVARLKSLNVSETVAKRLFTAAEREKIDLEAMEAFKALEGPDALKRMLNEMNKARPADSVPLERAMPWRKILSSNPKDVAEYRQRIFEAISDLPSFQNLTDEQKERLADLYAEAWENRKQAILDRMLRDEIKKARDRDEISEDVEKKLQQSRNKILEIVNLGGFNNDDLVKVLGERYGISTSFTEEQKERIQKLADQLQDEDMNTAKRNKLAMEFAVELAGAMDVPVSEIISNWWTSSVLFGPQTIFSIGAAFLNGGYSIATIGTRRMLAKLVKGDIQGAIEESILMLKGFARYLGAFKQSGRRAWSYLWTGDVGLLGTGSTDILSEINNFDQLQRFQRHKLLAEQLAKDPRMVRRYVGVYLRFVSRLLTALDAFNVMVTKAGTASLALRMSGMSTDKIIEAEKMLNLKAYKDQVIRDYFDNKAPKTQAEKALVDSYAEAEMYRAINKLGGKMENADYLASESAMTMHPTGFGGVVYDAITGFFAQRQSNADEYLEKMKKDWISNKDLKAVTFLALAYLRQFAAYNAAGLTGSKFVRYASNKFNQGLSFIPFAGLLRQIEAKDDRIKGKDAFRETIYRNQIVSFVMLMVGYSVIKAIQDEPDDEERGNFWNGGWANLTPDQKKQMLAKGQKEYTMGFKFNGRWYVFNYQNWPLNQILSAIGSMSDQVRFSPEKWDEKSALSKGVAGMVSGVKSTLEIPALSGLQELVGNRLASKDPTEKDLDRLSRVASGWVGGFVPRILKDIDFYTQPELRKYEGLWEKTASHIPIYRRYVGEEYYDILGQQIKRNVIPGSREFMMGPTEPEYKILGALNARNIFLTPANAEYRMVGKGRNRRRLTQEEADAYSLETGKGYRDMLLRYGQRALQMPTERARAFLQEKAEEVRDRALKRAYRR